jgi:5-methylcytosine-specific restriction endonuclease McrA
MDGVLVLNHNYQPLNVTNARRALGMLFLGKAHTVATDSKVFRSERLSIEMPSVVRLNHHVRRPMPVLHISRKSVFARDRYTCQYCGAHNVPLTIDHVVPKERGGGTDWVNLVCCCTACNNKKGNRTPDEVGMRLRRRPVRPKFIPYISYTKFLAAAANPAWRPYLAPYADLPPLSAAPAG